MEPKFEAVYSAGDLFEAELVKGMLAESGIESTIMNKHDSELLLGEVEIFVQEEDAPLALEIINKREFE
jgi:hypothetical protein